MERVPVFSPISEGRSALADLTIEVTDEISEFSRWYQMELDLDKKTSNGEYLFASQGVESGIVASHELVENRNLAARFVFQ